MRAEINYTAPMNTRPRYHANDQSRDVIDLDPKTVPIIDGRADPPSLDREGFALVSHRSTISDFRAPEAQEIYKSEVEAFISELTGADAVVINSPGIFRFGEKSGESGQHNNSRPARFIHVDVNDETADGFSKTSVPPDAKIKRAVHYNIWRAVTPPPQDVPLALCDARSVAPEDLIEADAVFDQEGQPDWSFAGLVVGASPRHRWVWFPDMSIDEAIIFVTNDSAPGRPHCVPHSAFDNPLCPADAVPRASIEMRAIAYWFE
ncbi:hypothetical protein CW354_15895 [Marinicaulis flavus]|uniref:Methyltransferase n=1 Tax=Hyphococcus luteus TaxID=2058213 RepID=A0A2S7K3A7_9PROT|nr:hypothetical protein CW354_15895 [Marinicaulis flavus]